VKKVVNFDKYEDTNGIKFSNFIIFESIVYEITFADLGSWMGKNPDPRSGMGKNQTRIRHKHPGSATQLPAMSWRLPIRIKYDFTGCLGPDPDTVQI